MRATNRTTRPMTRGERYQLACDMYHALQEITTEEIEVAHCRECGELNRYVELFDDEQLDDIECESCGAIGSLEEDLGYEDEPERMLEPVDLDVQCRECGAIAEHVQCLEDAADAWMLDCAACGGDVEVLRQHPRKADAERTMMALLGSADYSVKCPDCGATGYVDPETTDCVACGGYDPEEAGVDRPVPFVNRMYEQLCKLAKLSNDLLSLQHCGGGTLHRCVICTAECDDGVTLMGDDDYCCAVPCAGAN